MGNEHTRINFQKRRVEAFAEASSFFSIASAVRQGMIGHQVHFLPHNCAISAADTFLAEAVKTYGQHSQISETEGNTPALRLILP